MIKVSDLDPRGPGFNPCVSQGKTIFHEYCVNRSHIESFLTALVAADLKGHCPLVIPVKHRIDELQL